MKARPKARPRFPGLRFAPGAAVRALLLAFVLVPMLVFGAILLRPKAPPPPPILPPFDASAVERIVLVHGDDSLWLRKGRDGVWVVSSAADAPGDAARIAGLLQALRELRGRPVAAGVAKGAGAKGGAGQNGAAPPAPDAVTLRLEGRDGRELLALRFQNGFMKVLPDGRLFAVDRVPPLPMWPSAWSSLVPPRIAPGDIAKIERLTPLGLRPLDATATARVAQTLARVSRSRFVPAYEVDWTRAAILRLSLRDGRVVDVTEASPDNDGYLLRFDSETDGEVRATRRFAFHSATPLP